MYGSDWGKFVCRLCSLLRLWENRVRQNRARIIFTHPVKSLKIFNCRRKLWSLHKTCSLDERLLQKFVFYVWSFWDDFVGTFFQSEKMPSEMEELGTKMYWSWETGITSSNHLLSGTFYAFINVDRHVLLLLMTYIWMLVRYSLFCGQ